MEINLLMKLIILFSTFLFSTSFFFSQSILPNQSTPIESSSKAIEKYKATYNTESKNVITTQPTGSLRTMAEWEEVQSTIQF